MTDLVFYTDGAYSSSRQQGGIGIVMLKNNSKVFEYSNMYKNTTNNQMEIGAIIIVLRLIRDCVDSITIYTDSMYCVGCATLGWQRKKNRKMWEEFDKQYSRVKSLCPDIKILHVKGHQSGTNLTKEANWNNYVDKLAVKASQLI